MTEDDILDGLVTREGGFKNDPEDFSDPTNFGITAKVAGEWLGLERRATAVEMQTLITKPVAAAIYRKRFIDDPGFTPEHIPFDPLRVQLIDFGVNSGPERAVRWLQRVMGFAGNTVTGRLDADTQAILGLYAEQGVLRIVNDALVAARSYMIDTTTDAGTVNKKYEEGLESRALSFFLAKPVPAVDSASKEA